MVEKYISDVMQSEISEFPLGGFYFIEKVERKNIVWESLSYDNILIFYCSATNYHKFSSLKQYTFIISKVFMG